MSWCIVMVKKIFCFVASLKCGLFFLLIQHQIGLIKINNRKVGYGFLIFQIVYEYYAFLNTKKTVAMTFPNEAISPSLEYVYWVKFTNLLFFQFWCVMMDAGLVHNYITLQTPTDRALICLKRPSPLQVVYVCECGN